MIRPKRQKKLKSDLGKKNVLELTKKETMVVLKNMGYDPSEFQSVQDQHEFLLNYPEDFYIGPQPIGVTASRPENRGLNRKNYNYKYGDHDDNLNYDDDESDDEYDESDDEYDESDDEYDESDDEYDESDDDEYEDNINKFIKECKKIMHKNEPNRVLKEIHSNSSLDKKIKWLDKYCPRLLL